ncbi:MAG: bifunctional phosphoribosylaminoimidazolecarboxamide formyltransferase/IMP cyclohydrolase [Acidobacteriia bacterium]|nr:bifunctional phosphoribosylaminoimidazolecarboxamide formyltransferase/IMP cyclohydrolase [Terriglobia bacterium]
MNRRIQTALISVHDKTGLTDFAKRLVDFGIHIISTGGTARMLREASIPVRDVSQVTQSPEILDGRVKTLHPAIHGGLLANRSNPTHMEALKSLGIEPIDMVVVNLYPFELVAALPAARCDELIENIDIGGVTLIRAAAKNFMDVAVVVAPRQYAEVVRDLKKNEGSLSLDRRLRLAQQAFETATAYDAAIQQQMGDWRVSDDGQSVNRSIPSFPYERVLSMKKVRELRYGENPHQLAAVYLEAGRSRDCLAAAEPLQGKELSYNNLLDLDSAWRLAMEFDVPTAVLMKHNNPCGVASAEDVTGAYKLALACDPVSAFGSVMAFNRPVNRTLAEEVSKIFVEAIVAPQYETEVFEIFMKKKNLRLLERSSEKSGDAVGQIDWRQIDGGFLAQTHNATLLDESKIQVVSQRDPSEAEWAALRFAWRVVKHVKSNAIVFAKDQHTLGIGAGQMSRVDSVKLAVMKAAAGQLSLAESVVASDAFFPFRDGVDAAAEAGARAIIQPGGSVRDAEVIAAANERNLAMVFTGVRHFRH